MKKPLNGLSNPVQPYITKKMPRFVDAKRHYTVGTDVMMNLEAHTQLVEPAVLIQNRDEGTNRYGISSYRPTVTEEFRPPMLDPMLDTMPLSRMPWQATTVARPHINPSSDYLENNTSNSDNLQRNLTKRVKGGWMQQTFYMPIESTIDSSMTPDREFTIPQVSASAGFYSDFRVSNDNGEHIDLKYTNPSVSVSAGYNSDLRVNGEMGDIFLQTKQVQTSATAGYNSDLRVNGDMGDIFLQTKQAQTSVGAGYHSDLRVNGDMGDIFLQSKQAQTSATAGYQPGVYINGQLGTIADLVLETKGPNASVSAGFNSEYRRDNFASEDPLELSYNLPMASAGAGFSSNYRTSNEFIDGSERIYDLEYNIPMVSADSWKTSEYRTNQLTNGSIDKPLEQKLAISQSVLNASPGNIIRNTNSVSNANEHILSQVKPDGSFNITPTSDYRTQNSMSYKPHTKTRLQPMKREITNSSAVPYSGIGVF